MNVISEMYRAHLIRYLHFYSIVSRSHSYKQSHEVQDKQGRLMKVIPETYRAHLIRYLRFI